MGHRIVILGAGMNGLIARRLLYKHNNVVTLEAKWNVNSHWVGWKVLLDAAPNRWLLDKLGIPFQQRSADIGVMLRNGFVKNIKAMSDTELAEARKCYTLRTRRTAVGSESRLATERRLLEFDTGNLATKLMEGQNSAPITTGAKPILEHIGPNELEVQIGGESGMVTFDFLISTIPLWSLLAHEPLLTAVPMCVILSQDDSPHPQYHYVYLPFLKGLTRLVTLPSGCHAEAIRDPMVDPDMFSEARDIGMTGHMKVVGVPGQLIPQEEPVEAIKRLPANWLLLGRHAAWKANETIDKSIDRLTAWTVQNKIRMGF